ncbi:hypothetical protein V8E53_014653 [Lactarius tabidus]
MAGELGALLELGPVLRDGVGAKCWPLGATQAAKVDNNTDELTQRLLTIRLTVGMYPETPEPQLPPGDLGPFLAIREELFKPPRPSRRSEFLFYFLNGDEAPREVSVLTLGFQDLPKMVPSRSHVTLGELLPGAVVSTTPALDDPLPYILQRSCSVGIKDSVVLRIRPSPSFSEVGTAGACGVSSGGGVQDGRSRVNEQPIVVVGLSKGGGGLVASNTDSRKKEKTTRASRAVLCMNYQRTATLAVTRILVFLPFFEPSSPGLHARGLKEKKNKAMVVGNCPAVREQSRVRRRRHPGDRGLSVFRLVTSALPYAVPARDHPRQFIRATINDCPSKKGNEQKQLRNNQNQRSWMNLRRMNTNLGNFRTRKAGDLALRGPRRSATSPVSPNPRPSVHG